MKTQLTDDCSKYLLAISDTMDILKSKWKIKILIVLLYRSARFGEILNYFEGLTPRVLSKELSELEVNGLVELKAINDNSYVMYYQITESGHSLSHLIEELYAWGEAHRRRIIGTCSTKKKTTNR